MKIDDIKVGLLIKDNLGNIMRLTKDFTLRVEFETLNKKTGLVGRLMGKKTFIDLINEGEFELINEVKI